MFFKKDNDYTKYVGKIFYSPFFDRLLKVEQVKSDKKWSFRFYDEKKGVSGPVHRAESRLSHFVDNGLMR